MNKSIIITGTSRGIGAFLAQHYLKEGYEVIGSSRSGKSDFTHPNYRHLKLDVTDELSVKTFFFELKRTSLYPYALINNAGVAKMNHILLTPIKSVRQVFDTNFLGTFLMCREFGKWVTKKKSSRIVNFTTVAAPLNLEGEAIYAASKRAIESFTKVSAKELSPFGTTVNAIGPTPIDTDLIKGVPDDKIEAIINQQIIHRKGTFKDVVNVVDFFLSPKSDFITGQILYLGGV